MNDSADAKNSSANFTSVMDTEVAAIRKQRKLRLNDTDDEGGTRGLALSGGGIRSAATCIGAMQALNIHGRLNSFDYLSTVSGGGYAGACLSAAMSKVEETAFPFGGDVRDTRVLAHIRNYSNYLLPRSHSAIRNWSESIAILIRGILANAICVLFFLLLAVGITVMAYPELQHAPDHGSTLFSDPNLVLRFGLSLFGKLGKNGNAFCFGFIGPIAVASLLAINLTIWAAARSLPQLDSETSDTRSLFLVLSCALLPALLFWTLLDLQPLAIGLLRQWHMPHLTYGRLTAFGGFLASFATGVIGFAGKLGAFLKSTERSPALQTNLLRFATRMLILLAALVLPLLLWFAYLGLCAWASDARHLFHPLFGQRANLFEIVLFASFIVMCCFRANGYSLHRLYRDRLSKAFLVSPIPSGGDEEATPTKATPAVARGATRLGDLPPLDRLLLSDLADSPGPYPIINAALNVQGSAKANKRGREADFFVFTPDWVGSRLTGYARTTDMQTEDVRLDLGTAMAISGAAASANMGGATIRLLSPTLSLLNVRLGYYLRNPRFLSMTETAWPRIKTFFLNFKGRFFLFIEMFNGLSENLTNIYLTDGGHIENLGIYELLRRKCAIIFAIDAEADPEISCGSLLKLERFARIDLGIRIYLPWEDIRRCSGEVTNGLPSHNGPCRSGPHAAIGKILYDDGSEGLLVYVKASLSGDERDYVIDYATRNPSFPHESTGDQFFSEEQFEMYRALGFHMVDGVFSGDQISFDPRNFTDLEDVRNQIDRALPVTATLRSPDEIAA
jgi:hypothetical protein